MRLHLATRQRRAHQGHRGLSNRILAAGRGAPSAMPGKGIDVSDTTGGDADGFDIEALYRREHARIHAMCMAILHEADDAEDAVQETFARVALRLEALAGNPVGYLVVVAATCAATSSAVAPRAARCAESIGSIAPRKTLRWSAACWNSSGGSWRDASRCCSSASSAACRWRRSASEPGRAATSPRSASPDCAAHPAHGAGAGTAALAGAAGQRDGVGRGAAVAPRRLGRARVRKAGGHAADARPRAGERCRWDHGPAIRHRARATSWRDPTRHSRLVSGAGSGGTIRRGRRTGGAAPGAPQSARAGSGATRHRSAPPPAHAAT